MDLVIRSGGDKRLSNFLLWQCAHAWIYVVEAYWPAITRQDIETGFQYYDRRMKQEAKRVQSDTAPRPVSGRKLVM
ncbi:MAG: undecaprenyl diphosphate synthase family protein [Anaerolineae bacterium]